MKIISTKEYNRLKDIEDKYNDLIGQTVTICNGGRSRYATLLNMSACNCFSYSKLQPIL